MSITVRKSADRGHANHNWLNTYHTFSFAMYYDPKFEGFRSLRVLNEDRVKPSRGFGTHSHSDFEIFSYVISGFLEHKDSMGNVEVIPRGGVQFTSAGSGLSHSEYNHSHTKPVHFLQMWVSPNQNDLKPAYDTRIFSDEEKLNKLCQIITAKTEHKDPSLKAIGINQDVKVFASLLEKGKDVTYRPARGRYLYVHVCDTGGKISVNDVELEAGDGASFIRDIKEDIQITGISDSTAEFLLFDLA